MKIEKLKKTRLALSLSKGFTLVELLIVMGVIAILMTVIVVGIDPADKLNSSRDSKVQQDTNTIASAMEAYAAGHNGTYPCNPAANLNSDSLTLSGELKTIPKQPDGTSYSFNDCTTGIGSVFGQVKSKKFLTDSSSPFYITGCGGTCTGYWIWCSSTGKATQVSSVAACP